MRYRWLLVVVVIGLLGATPAAARIVVVEPNDEINLGMDPAEVKKLATLQSTTFPSILSEVSPDDTTILSIFLRTNAPDTVEFVNVNDGSTRRVSEDVLDLEPLSEVVWRDNRTAVYLSTNTRLGTVLVELDRETGTVKTREVDIPGFILSLAPNARRVLIVRLAVEEMSIGDDRRSPFDTVVKQAPGQPTGPIRFDAQGEVLRVASDGVQLSILDLNSGEIMPIVRYPEGTALIR